MVGRHPLAYAALIALVASLVSGCIGDDGDDAPLGPDPGPGPTRLVTYYLTKDLKLTTELPTADELVLPSPFSGASFEFLTFDSDPLATATLLAGPSVNATLFVKSSAILVSNGAVDAALWAGSSRGMPFSGFATYPGSAVPPNTVAEMRYNMSLEDMVPPSVPAGTSLRLIVGAFGDFGAGTVRLQVGGEKPSQVVFPLAELPSDPLAPRGEVKETKYGGEVVGFDGFDCSRVPEVQVRPHDIPVDANATFLNLVLAPTGSGDVDLDFSIWDGERMLSTSHTPGANEEIVLAGEAFAELRGKTLDLRVYGCSGGRIAYEVVARQG